MKVVLGLSPRVRGNPARRVSSRSRMRSIPACAGEPHKMGERQGIPTVYPRVCGGTVGRGKHEKMLKGLSPRVRGNLRQHESLRVSARSIPACAGEPVRSTRSGDSAKVYPRVCGGTYPFGGESIGTGGLSPRVRGNHAQVTAERDHKGSIPACAGEPIRRRNQ